MSLSPRMSQNKAKKVRGVYEHPHGSGVWWAQYFIQGRRYRERAGSRSNAITLYRKRKTEALTAIKLPELNRRHVTLGELMDDAIAFAEQHHKSTRHVKEKADAARPKLGSRWADSLTHSDFAEWIDAREVSSATFNRYKSFFSLCYREGMRSGKVQTNPARLIRRRRESSGRKRFLSEKEYAAIHGALVAKLEAARTAYQRDRWRWRLAAFVTSVWTGMRLSEQFTLQVSQVNWDRNEIQLADTKNGDAREIPMTLEVRRELAHAIGTRKSGLVFERERDGKASVDLDWFDDLLEELEIGDYTWHSNRHTFCSWHAIAGTPLKTIQELAGHRAIATTAKYAHLSPNSKHNAMEAMAAAHRKVSAAPKQAKRA